MNTDSVSRDELVKGIRAFEANERRDAMYKVATFLVEHFWGKPRDMADGMGVLLLTWNQALYRYGGFDFALLEEFIAKNMPILGRYRRRDIGSYSEAENGEIINLFMSLLEALRSVRDGKPGPRSPVAAPKALHLLAPHFFPLWDKEIAKAYGTPYSYRPALKYLDFLQKVRRMARLVDSGITEAFGGKSTLKLIDEYNYSKHTKGWI